MAGLGLSRAFWIHNSICLLLQSGTPLLSICLGECKSRTRDIGGRAQGTETPENSLATYGVSPATTPLKVKPFPTLSAPLSFSCFSTSHFLCSSYCHFYSLQTRTILLPAPRITVRKPTVHEGEKVIPCPPRRIPSQLNYAQYFIVIHNILTENLSLSLWSSLLPQTGF